MPNRSYVCVYCGSSVGRLAAYSESATRVGRALARRGLGLVYGGGQVGLMGVVADAVLSEGGRVVGVIPTQLSREEIAHQSLSEMHVVPGMHERKALMADRASAFLTLPGGIGTYEEFFEGLTWAAIGIHSKPLGLLNVAGYFDPLIRLLEHSRSELFLRPDHLSKLHVDDDPDRLLDRMLGESNPSSKS